VRQTTQADIFGLIKDIYGSRSGHKNFHKDPIHVGSVEPIHGVSAITMADDATHARQRRALSHAFSTKALLEQEYILQGYINKFSGHMQKFAKSGETFDILDWFAYATFDIIGDLALGEPFGCMDSVDARFWVPLISQTIMAGSIEQATTRMATAGSFMQKALKWCIPNSVRGPRMNHLAYSRELVLKRMGQSQNDHKDFIYYLMKQHEAGNLAKDEIIINGALMINAGTETTAGFLGGLFNHLLRNPAILSRLTEEIRTTFKAEKDIKFEALSKLQYMTACIEEGLRIYPSAAIGFTRTVPEGGDTVTGHWLPGGTTVSVTMWAATHSERNFKDPYRYDPERWLGDAKYAGDKHGASQPFSLGSRGCIGRK
jgi:cytochrome P450